jgi:lysophospholipase L1-like esterase
VVRGLGGNDELLLHDGVSDQTIDCGSGAADHAVLDRLPLDPNGAIKGCERRERSLPGPYVALGDSLSIGFSASSPAKGYVGLLDSGYQSSLGVNQLLDEGEAGASTTTLRDNGQLADALADINAPSDTKAVTIDIGGYEAFFPNNCPGHWDEPNVCPVRANLAFIFSQLKTALASDPGTELFTAMAYYNPASGKGGATEASYETKLLGTNHAVGCSDTAGKVGLNDLIHQEAGKLGVPVADPYWSFKQHGQAYMSSTDSLHVHPNDAGYAAIAQAFGSPSRLCG